MVHAFICLFICKTRRIVEKMRTEDNRHNGVVQRACNPQPIYYLPWLECTLLEFIFSFCLLTVKLVQAGNIVPEYLHNFFCRLLLGVIVSLKIACWLHGLLGPCNQRSIYRRKKRQDKEEAKTNQLPSDHS